jgi:catalase
MESKHDSEMRSIDRSEALSQEGTAKDNIKGRKIAILVAEGFSYGQVMQVKSMLEEAGAKVETVSKHQKMLDSVEGDQMEVDMSYSTTQSVLYDAVFIPGGQHIETLKMQGDALNFVHEAFKHCKPIGATAEGVDFLRSTEIKGVQLRDDVMKDDVLVDIGVVTARAAGNGFADSFMKAIAQHRHWAREMKEQVPA